MKKRFIVLIILVVVSIPILFFYENAGHWLVVNDKLSKSDAIVVLMGSPGDRILEANDIYNDSFSKKLFFVEDNDPGRLELRSRGINLPNDANESQLIAIQLGIPDSSIIIIPGNANSTFDEATALLNYLNDNINIDTIIIVSSASHTRRASFIFNNVLSNCDREISIIIRPSKYSEFNPENWFFDRGSRKKVVMEYIKLIQYSLFD